MSRRYARSKLQPVGESSWQSESMSVSRRYLVVGARLKDGVTKFPTWENAKCIGNG